MTRIKLCGLMAPEDARIANELMPEYVGFVYAKGSKRYRGQAVYEGLREILNPDIISVGVFKDNDPEEIADAVNSGAISVVQLHGAEDEAYIKALKDKLNVIIIKTLGVGPGFDPEKAAYCSADFLMFDTPGGGSGKTFDHSILNGIDRPFFLAGGLNPHNVGHIIETVHPYAVDVSSGIETDGKKDPKKMRAFVEAVRGCD